MRAAWKEDARNSGDQGKVPGNPSSRRSKLGVECTRHGHREIGRASRSGAREPRGAAGRAEEKESTEPETRPGEGRSVGRSGPSAAEAPGPQLPWPAESMIRRRPSHSWSRGGGLGRRSRAGRTGTRSPRTHQPAEPLQPPWHYVINDATAHFRFDACSAFVPPPRALSNKGIVCPVSVHLLQPDWLRLRAEQEGSRALRKSLPGRLHQRDARWNGPEEPEEGGKWEDWPTWRHGNPSHRPVGGLEGA